MWHSCTEGKSWGSAARGDYILTPATGLWCCRFVSRQPFSVVSRHIYNRVGATDQSGEKAMREIPITMADKDGDEGGEVGVELQTRQKTQRPPLYKVLILNDDYTPMEFVVLVLERFFGMSHAQSVEVMLTVHKKGVAVVGVFTFEIAETKVAQVMGIAQQHQHPLLCEMEES